MKTFVLLLLGALNLNLTHSVDAADNPARYNQIQFQVERSQPVDNDRMQAVLSITAENDNAAQLADHINRSMSAALTTAKARAKIEVHTGNYQTYPVYAKEKIRRWRATQEMVLETADFAALSSLLGQLQQDLQLTSINFSISPQRRRIVEDELIVQALDDLKQRAELVRKQIATKTYRIVDISINTAGARPIPRMRAGVMEAMTKSVAAPAIEAGTSTITVNLNAVIELQ
ncbi:MAG: SIMPL domain-containing protein [Gammaproteobacteria bacterium]|nr:SIMPL domain-containing protein [Gammaproteobacteria bacterium]